MSTDSSPTDEPIPPEVESVAASAEDVAGDDDEAWIHRHFVLKRETADRLDKFLCMRLGGASRHQIQKLIQQGGVTVNGKTAKASQPLRRGDVIDAVIPPPPVPHCHPEPIPLNILYEDEHLIVLNKQSGMIVHPARSNLSGTLINGLAYHFQQQARAGEDGPGLSCVGAGDLRPGVIHRLDKNTTGVIVFAKSEIAHWKVAKQFEDRTTLKVYLAVVHGQPDGVGGVIDLPIGKHPTIREAQAVRYDSLCKPSVTLYRVRERYAGYALVELELKTGRTHQIRVHLSHMGHPIAGDILYGGEPIGYAELDAPPSAAGARRHLNFARPKAEGERIDQVAAGREDMILSHPALHAALLRVHHPIRRETMRFTAPLHEPMATLVRELRKRPATGPVAKDGVWIDLNEAVPGERQAGS